MRGDGEAAQTSAQVRDFRPIPQRQPPWKLADASSVSPRRSGADLRPRSSSRDHCWRTPPRADQRRAGAPPSEEGRMTPVSVPGPRTRRDFVRSSWGRNRLLAAARKPSLPFRCVGQRRAHTRHSSVRGSEGESRRPASFGKATTTKNRDSSSSQPTADTDPKCVSPETRPRSRRSDPATSPREEAMWIDLAFAVSAIGRQPSAAAMLRPPFPPPRSSTGPETFTFAPGERVRFARSKGNAETGAWSMRVTVRSARFSRSAVGKPAFTESKRRPPAP